MHRSFTTLVLAGLLTIAACGDENLTFPGADGGSNQSGATSTEPTATPDSSATPTPTESPESTPTPGATCVGQGEPCGALGDGATCCSGFVCAGICVPAG